MHYFSLLDTYIPTVIKFMVNSQYSTLARFNTIHFKISIQFVFKADHHIGQFIPVHNIDRKYSFSVHPVTYRSQGVTVSNITCVTCSI